MISDLSSLSRYLQGLSAEGRLGEREYAVRPFVTISREAGAGGRSLADAVLREASARGLGAWHRFDDELCKAVLADPKIRTSLEALVAERVRGALEDELLQLFGGESSQAHVYGRMFQCVRRVAALGNAVILGRGAACYTRKLEGGVHVRLTAPRSVRVARMASVMGLRHADAETWIDEQDSNRALLVRRYFKRDVADPLLYDAVWNTGSLSVETIARCVVDLAVVRSRAPMLEAS